MNTQTEKSKDDYSGNFKCLSFVLFPLYDSYHRLCCVTLITSNASQIVKFKVIAAYLQRYICESIDTPYKFN